MPTLTSLFPTRRPERPKSPKRKRSIADLRRFVATLSSNMGPSNSDGQATKAPLSVLVVLPPSAHLQHHAAPNVRPSRPSPLVTRLSSSMIPSLQQTNQPADQKSTGGGQTDVDDVVVASRRLSLAPGLGTGTSTFVSNDISPTASEPPSSSEHVPTVSTSLPSSSSSKPAPPPFGQKRSDAQTNTNSEDTPIPSTSSSGRPPAFGAKRSSTMTSRGPARRRPQTATVPTASGLIAPGLMAGMANSRASLAGPSGVGGGGGGFGRSRPGWEADEVVGNLRGSGLEVTVIRHASHLPQLLDPAQQSSFAPAPISRPSDSAAPLTHIILIPLSDSPAFPSLSLLLNQGTTPTAVCFQQDLLDRAKRTEDEWLPAAVENIQIVIEMTRDIGRTGQNVNTPIVIAYSANPALSQTAINACMAAGAASVLKPPYNSTTATMVRTVAQAYQEGRLLPNDDFSPVGRSSSVSSTSTEPLIPEETHVVLPPTALSMGGEHEGEKVLSAAVANSQAHRRTSSGNWSVEPEALKRNSTSKMAAANSRKGSAVSSVSHLPPPPPTPPRDDLSFSPPDYTLPFSFAGSAFASQPSPNPRRRSVDVGGLALALKRAASAFEVPKHESNTGLLKQITEGFPSPATPTKTKPAPASSVKSPFRPGQMSSDGANAESAKDTELAELLSAMYYQSVVTIDVQMRDYDELSAPLSGQHRERLIDHLATWNFKPHNLAEGDLYRVACLMFEAILATEGLAELQIERGQINRLLFAIRAIYHAPNPYHNYVHAIDVLQATYMFLVNIGVAPPFEYMRFWTPQMPVWKRDNVNDQPLGAGTYRAREVMRPQDVLAVLVAAMGHDVGHPGLSNAFMKNAKVPLSQVYEDKSVLENMHCMLVVQLLRKHGFGFLIEGNPIDTSVDHDQKAFRKILYSSVLATDMSLHFAWIQRLKEFDERLRDGEVGEDEDDRIMICQALIKCADISNPTRPIDVSQHWSSVLLEEWAKQASLEQDLDLPVSVVASADACLQAKGQIGFIDLFTQPLFDAVSDALPELQPYADSCADNRALWQSRLDELRQREEEQGEDLKTLIQPPVEGASHDERFKSLFPLLLPISLVAGLTPSTTIEADMDQPGSPSSLITPSGSYVGSTVSTSQDIDSSGSPAAKAMRAVYYAKLVDPSPRSRMTSWSRGSGIGTIAAAAAAAGINVERLGAGDWNEVRRMSTPEVLVVPQAPFA
ncbi:hypothetical protein IAR55_000561 [Kwoniella newhampshirensis]|uniref:Phosphodiesterase n=1 Tax=Kwoniella newhampshirensis TaxID=1651941 RepID=A0AAW0Z6Y0_9TREE